MDCHDRLDDNAEIAYHGRIEGTEGVMDRILTVDDFAPHVGKSFTPRGQQCTLTLVSIERPLFAGMESLPRAPFTLLFTAPAGDVLPEGVYDVAVPDGLDLSIFINPIRTAECDPQNYQAVFN